MNNAIKKKILLVNFTSHDLSETTYRQLGKPPVMKMPLEIRKETNIAYFIDEALATIQFENAYNHELKEWDITYLVILPGLNILAGMICRCLSERGIPYQIVNLIRDHKSGDFIIQDIY